MLKGSKTIKLMKWSKNKRGFTQVKAIFLRHGVKVGPGPQDVRPRDPGPTSKFKSGILIMKFLHCLTYFVLANIYIIWK